MSVICFTRSQSHKDWASTHTPHHRSDWKIEQNYFTVDAPTPPAVLSAITEAATTVMNNNRSEYDEMYGFLAVFHGFEKPNKVVIRTFHRWRWVWGYSTRIHLIVLVDSLVNSIFFPRFIFNDSVE